MVGGKGQNERLVLAAMIFACGLTFIDQTIVSIAVPELQKDLGLSETGIQWVVNGYLLALAALFAFGGRISDIVGHTSANAQSAEAVFVVMAGIMVVCLVFAFFTVPSSKPELNSSRSAR